ncbi:MAG TPA: hypothetical protein PK957_01060 [Candidatus Dojkabacteria bacterium]|nr:hypothetical protein [Candidatus Dojkabacteria bacterium]HQF36205.1 hypothetical protein [Candidatus Dojkabacteria bacterium]
MEKIFNKVMKVVSCFLLSLFIISTFWGGSVNAADGDITDFTDVSELLGLVYTEEGMDPGTNVTMVQNANMVAALQVVVCSVEGESCTGLSEESLDALYERNPTARRLGDGVIGRLDNGLKTALYSYPGDVTMGNAIYQDWSPSRMNKAEAASSGTQILSPIRKLYEYVRGIAYVCSVLVIVVISFMIMFRQKVGGQVAVTITNALPRVLIGFVLIHFSFWIASVILSLSTFLMAVSEVAISNAIKDISGITDIQTIGLGGPFHLWWGLFRWIIGPVVVDSDSMFFGSKAGAFYNSIPATFGLSTVWKSFFSQGVDLSFGALVVRLIFLVGLIFAVFKIFFNLIKAYAQIFLKVIALPITTLLGMFPGQEKSIIESYKSILIDSLVFPITFIIINLAILISVAGNPTLGGSAIEFPSGLTTSIIDSQGTNLTGFIAYAMILVATTAERLIAEMLKYQETRSGQLTAAAIMGTTQKVPFFGTLLKE